MSVFQLQPQPSDEAAFNHSRHVKYWLRCLKTHLPTLYQANDSTRMTLAFFTLSALDLLNALHSSTSDIERATYIDWIYRCQHPNGGFRGFTGADPGRKRDFVNECWDPANLAATYFALAALVVLKDDLRRVERNKCLRWMRDLQLGDGSFGDALAGVKWILSRSGAKTRISENEDFNVEALVRYLLSLQTHEGGFGNAPFQEAQAGWTYCALGALSLLGRLPYIRKAGNGQGYEKNDDNSSTIQSLLHWLTSRQTSLMQGDGEYKVADGEHIEYTKTDKPDLGHVQRTMFPRSEDPWSTNPNLEVMPDDLLWAGFNGRCNKIADTCYSFWAGGTLAILSQVHLMNFDANQRYLLEKTQHLIGGFGKLPGDPPDIMHSYLGLAALACMRNPELKRIDPALCFSISARDDFLARVKQAI